MDKIIINGVEYDPYFMLGVVPEDSESFITKMFRKKAKMWHPDKIKFKDPSKVEKAQIYFKILVESYEYILNKKRSIQHSKKREHINVSKHSTLKTKNIDNIEELDTFNKEFEKMNIQNPNDYGYDTERISNLEEYEQFNYKPYKLFETKHFNINDFNRAFEYQQELYDTNNEVAVYHKTTDGFNGYNSGDLNGVANISSYNGIMIIGDNYGKEGLGYYDTNYSDYKKTFEGPKNPQTKINVPTDFKSSKYKSPKSKKNLKQREREIPNNPGNGDKANFRLQEKLLLEKQEYEMKQKIEKDKQMILEYQHLYNDPLLIQAALDYSLPTSKDYVNEDTIDKRFKFTNL